MIRLFDAFVLANTKLRTHKVRTGITIGIAGILFGLILGAVFIVQGILDSVGRFGQEGLNSRPLVVVSRYTTGFEVYAHQDDPAFIAKVEAAHKLRVDKKAAIAKKYTIPYDPKLEDPSPIGIDKQTKQKQIPLDNYNQEDVLAAANTIQQETFKPLDMKVLLASYPSAHTLPDNGFVRPDNGDVFTYMKDGKELTSIDRQQMFAMEMGEMNTPSLQVVNQSVAAPFINRDVHFDVSKGEIPVIVPFGSAEKLLGLKPLPNEASTKQKYDRLQQVRRKIGTVTESFCYRNAASQALYTKAVTQREAMKEAETNSQPYAPPVQQYTVPAADSCGPVTIKSDTRTTQQKKADENRVAYEKELGTYIGDPVQYKVTVRPIGISGDAMSSGSISNVAGMVQGLLGSWLTMGSQWAVPADMVRQLPKDKQPQIVLDAIEKGNQPYTMSYGSIQESSLVEFGDAQEAQAFLKRYGFFAATGSPNQMYVAPYGSGMLVIAELKAMFTQVMLWALLTVGGVAIIILGSIIGRTVSESRRESAVFRAIGARRTDIGSIYGVYAFLLSIRVALFAVILGLVLSIGVDILFSPDATIGAQYSYAASDTTTQFHFVSVISWYLPVILAAIIVFGMIASIIPVVRSARRNPIKDMRDDT